MQKAQTRSFINIVVIVAALGYFVDIYDLILFGIVKDRSLISLGITNKAELFTTGNFLLSMQMFGMLLGGIVWGIMGDKRGRLSTLFFTIFLYSVANIANGFVTNVNNYAILRFIAGFGLSGELGVGITLVSEILSKESRGLGASFVNGIGIIGSPVAFFVAEEFSWRVAYWVGGTLGLILLILRIAVYESGMYERVKSSSVRKGAFLTLFSNIKRFKKFIICILLAIPTWYSVSVLVINASAFGEDALHLSGSVKGSTSVMLHYIGAAIGSFLFGYISMKLKSRKKAIITALIFMSVFTSIYFMLFKASPVLFYMDIFLLGIPMGGLWSVFITTASEQFGTNLRATVTTTAPNFVRGSTVLLTFLLGYFRFIIGLWSTGVLIGLLFIGIAIISALFLEETYHKDLDYVEDV